MSCTRYYRAARLIHSVPRGGVEHVNPNRLTRVHQYAPPDAIEQLNYSLALRRSPTRSGIDAYFGTFVRLDSTSRAAAITTLEMRWRDWNNVPQTCDAEHAPLLLINTAASWKPQSVESSHGTGAVEVSELLT